MKKLRRTLAELKARSTLCVGHESDLKIDALDERVWLSRMTKADGAPADNIVVEEAFINGNWQPVRTYIAKS